MTNTSKITLAPSRDIPFNKLVLSQANVRRIKAGVSVEELAEDIARRGLLQGLSVRPVVSAEGAETGMYAIPAGGRRYRALELLVKQKRLAKTAPVPCVVRESGIPEEDSLAENVQRAPLHPLDQFRAFLALREKGQSEEEIAAAFFVSVSVVKQRLKLASVSSRILDAYAEDQITLDQLMAFTVNGDHERQEQVFDRLSASWEKQPYTIRRMLTEGAVRASDKRAQFVGIDDYVEAGGAVLRDLFQGDDGGWLQDIGLVDRLVERKLQAAANDVQAEGWKWIEVAIDFPYGHTFGLRQLRGTPFEITDDEVNAREALKAEADRLYAEHESAGELPPEVDARLGEIETALGAIEERPLAFEPDDVARAGVFVSIGRGGELRIERGFVRPEDEAPVEPEPSVEDAAIASDDSRDEIDREEVQPSAEPEEEDGIRPLSDRLLTELTSYRTVGLRAVLGDDPRVAFVAALHALTLKAFYPYALDSCLELDLRSIAFSVAGPELSQSAAAERVRARHERWRQALPAEAGDLWGALIAMDEIDRGALFAHVVSLSVNAVHEAWNRRPRAQAHADRLSQALDLNMAALGWMPTVDNYLGRVTKARILQGVAEAKGQRAADRIEHLKKGEMAVHAEALLAHTGWLPEPLRTPGMQESATAEPAEDVAEPPVAQSDGDGGEPALADPERWEEDSWPADSFVGIAAE